MSDYPPQFKLGKALWKTADSEQTVDIVDYLGVGDDGRHYARAENGTGIPLDELQYEGLLPLPTSAQTAPEAAESEIVGFTDLPKNKTLEKMYNRSLQVAEDIGKTVEDWVPSAVGKELNLAGNRLLLGTTVGAVAILGGGLIVDRFARAQHEGRSKRGIWHGTDTGAALGFGAGLLTLARTSNPGAAAAALGLGVFVGNSLYDSSFRHGTPQTNIVKNALVGATSIWAYQQTRKLMPLGIQAFTTHLARYVPQSAKSFLTELRSMPGIGALLSLEAIPLAVAAAVVPTSHSIITRAMARQKRKSHESSAMLPTMMENNAGAQGGKTYTGVVTEAILPDADVNVHGSLRTHYDMNRARRELI